MKSRRREPDPVRLTLSGYILTTAEVLAEMAGFYMDALRNQEEEEVHDVEHEHHFLPPLNTGNLLSRGVLQCCLGNRYQSQVYTCCLPPQKSLRLFLLTW